MTEMEIRLLAELRWLAGHYTTDELQDARLGGWLPLETVASRHDLFIERAKLVLFECGAAGLDGKDAPLNPEGEL